ncbi:hypothetical protein M441DRAFT_110396, partial [Trichoderma asperellum CBS 433.97]
MLLSADSRRAGQRLVWPAEPACSGLSGSDSGLFSLVRIASALVHRRFPLSAARPLHLVASRVPHAPPPSELSPALQASTLTKPVGPALAS